MIIATHNTGPALLGFEAKTILPGLDPHAADDANLSVLVYDVTAEGVKALEQALVALERSPQTLILAPLRAGIPLLRDEHAAMTLIAKARPLGAVLVSGPDAAAAFINASAGRGNVAGMWAA